MISIFAIAICFLELSLAYLFQLPDPYWGLAWQAEAVLICMAAIYSNGGQRDRSILLAITIWMVWQATTDWTVNYFPYFLMQSETLVFSALVFWAIVRPYITPSHKLNPGTVCLAFYHGDNAPVLSSLSALFGLPFASVTVLANGSALHPDRHTGLLMRSDAEAIQRSGAYTIIDTGIAPDEAFYAAFDQAVGSSVKVGIFRIGCLKALSPVLNCINIAPTGVFQHIPSIFFYRALGVLRGNTR